MTTVLVTGGAGFIGSHLSATLLKAGYNVFVLDNFDPFYSPKWKRRNLAQTGIAHECVIDGDIRNRVQVEEWISRVRPETIIHLAARAGVRPSIEEPLVYNEVNVTGTLNLLEAARRFGTKNFIFGSSSSVYGESGKAPFREDEYFLRPISPYAATKLSGEAICFTYHHLYSLNVACLRFFTVYGPRQRPDLAIHKFVAGIEKGEPIPFFGDGTTGRDYTFVDDIVHGILAATRWAAESSKSRFEIFNLGNSSPVTLHDLVREVEEATGKSAELKRLPKQTGDVSLTWADISKAQLLLGYRPVTRLPEGLRKFVAWYRNEPRDLRL